MRFSRGWYCCATRFGQVESVSDTNEADCRCYFAFVIFLFPNLVVAAPCYISCSTCMRDKTAAVAAVGLQLLCNDEGAGRFV